MIEDLTEDEDTEGRWPKDGDRLFVEAPWAFAGNIVRDPAERSYRLPMGYKRAGDILIRRAEHDPVDRQNIIYAALFCYRQTIELCLKSVIEKFGECEPSKPKLTHNLVVLWEKFMCIADERGVAETDGLEAIQALVAEMHTADERADGFRFAASRNDAPFGFGDRGIDLANLREVMQGVVNFFECADSVFSEQDDHATYGY
jgi:hypothetical protein